MRAISAHVQQQSLENFLLQSLYLVLIGPEKLRPEASEECARSRLRNHCLIDCGLRPWTIDTDIAVRQISDIYFWIMIRNWRARSFIKRSLSRRETVEFTRE